MLTPACRRPQRPDEGCATGGSTDILPSRLIGQAELEMTLSQADLIKIEQQLVVSTVHLLLQNVFERN